MPIPPRLVGSYVALRISGNTSAQRWCWADRTRLATLWSFTIAVSLAVSIARSSRISLPRTLRKAEEGLQGGACVQWTSFWSLFVMILPIEWLMSSHVRLSAGTLVFQKSQVIWLLMVRWYAYTIVARSSSDCLYNDEVDWTGYRMS